MSATRDPDRIVRDWLDLMPDEAPDRAIAAVLQAVESTPQVRRWLGGRWRPTQMNRLLVAVGAAVVVIAAGTVLIARSGTSSVGTSPIPSVGAAATAGAAPSAFASAGAAASNGPLPAALLARWMGGNSSFNESGAGSSLVLAADGMTITQSNMNDRPLLTAAASTSSPGTLRVSESTAQDCRATDFGVYTWTESPSGRTLTIKLGSDDCAGRGAALAGSWYRMGCRNPETNCLGAIDAGTYASQFARPTLGTGDTWTPKFGAVTYTVPEGWANYADWPGWIGLTPVADFDRTTATQLDPEVGIIVDGQVTAESQATPCSGTADARVASTPVAVLDSIRHVRGLTVGPATAITINGRSGLWADLAVDPAKTGGCGSGGVVEYMIAGGEAHGIGPTERRRLVLLDLGTGHLVAIEIQSGDPGRFDALVAASMPIVQSLRFS